MTVFHACAHGNSSHSVVGTARSPRAIEVSPPSVFVSSFPWTYQYAPNTEVELIKLCVGNWSFLEWTGPVSNHSGMDHVHMTEDKTIGATFVETSVSIDGADICGDNIAVTLGGAGLRGLLRLQLNALGSSHTIYSASAPAGAHSLHFGWPTVPAGVEYTSLTATWSPCAQVTDTYDVHFMNLGVYTHTAYAAAYENLPSCQTNGQVNACFSSGPPACNKTSGTLWGKFTSETLENGPGYSISHGGIQREYLCQPPPSGCANYFRENLSSFSGFCGSVSATTVARSPGNTRLACGDRVCILGHGIKTVTDTGDLTTTQLDHFMPGVNACDNPGDFCGPTITIKLY